MTAERAMPGRRTAGSREPVAAQVATRWFHGFVRTFGRAAIQESFGFWRERRKGKTGSTASRVGNEVFVKPRLQAYGFSQLNCG